MRLSTRTIYATGACIELALGFGRGRLSAQEIARRQAAPVRLLEQVLADLRKAGLVDSSRGPKGGYALAQRPDVITMRDVYRVTEGGSGLVPPAERERALRQPHLRLSSQYWREAHQALIAELGRTTLAMLAERYIRERSTSGMYYI